jgi:predicted metal-dependent phosphoesterase TrpH
MGSRPFLADFHVHTNMSDGSIPLRDVIDLYGSHGFGAIAITDHIAEEETFIGQAAIHLEKVLNANSFPKYLKEVEQEGARAWDRYRMVVIPGFELSQNSISNRRSAHLLGLGISSYLPADGDAVDLIREIHDQGGIAIAAHPVHTRKMEKQTYQLWDRREELAPHFDAWEVASGPFLFDEVARTGLPKIASGDLHVARQIRSWKTVLHCERHPQAILDAIRAQEISFTFYEP